MSILKVQYLEQYSGPFAMEEKAFNSIVDYARSINLSEHIAASKIKQGGSDDDDMGSPLMAMTDDGIACFTVCGSMTKYGSSLSGGPSTIALRKSLRQAANDPKCLGGLMDFDTPGGTSDGTEELASEIAAFASKKPIWGFANGMACSAGYWALSQCTYCMSAPVAIIGSIGTYGMLYDRTEQFKQNGIKAYMIKSGKMKGTGMAGTEITDEQRADQQRVVDEINSHFVSGVSKGRKMTMDQAKELSDGRVHVGANAKSLNLVDAIGSFDDAMSGLRSAIASANKMKPKAPGMVSGAKSQGAHMSETATVAPVEQTATAAPPAQAQAPAAASLKDLKTKFPKSTADWREKCQEDGLTLAQSADRWMTHLEEQNEKLAAAAKTPGVKAVATGSEKEAGKDAAGAANPKAELNRIASEYQKTGMKREAAFTKACVENPELREAWVNSHTEQFGQKVKAGQR